MDGFINLLKPPGMTSSNAVVAVRRMFPRGTRVGHGGTLDPDAAGVLPICVGRATRLFDYIIDKEKVYIAEAALGVETDTQDATGAAIACAQVNAGRADILRGMAELTGWIEQVPPMYSAIKRDGQRMYELARKGQQAQLSARPAWVSAFEYIEKTGQDRHLVRIACGKGVYVRTLIHDLGRKLGCGAHMAFLLRTRSGAFDIDRALTLDELKHDPAGALMPLDMPLEHLPAVCVGAEKARLIANGAPFDAEGLEPQPPEGVALRVYVDGRFAGIGQSSGGMVRFRALLMRAE
jgi:tRNA pseudouridine55 synthase